MYTPTQLEAIKLFGRKDLTEGCISIEKDWTLWKCDISKEWRTINLPEWQRNVTSSKMEWEILWHIPQLSPDLFRVFWNRWDIIEVKYWFTNNWIIEEDKLIIITDFCKNVIPYNPTIPLLDQPSLPDIISLFK